MIENGVGILLVVAGIACAIIVIAMSAIRAARGCGDSRKFIWPAVLVVLVLVAKFDIDPTAAECPAKQAPTSSSQEAAHRCTIGNALSYILASGGIGIGKTIWSLSSGGLLTQAGRAELSKEVRSDVEHLSPVVAGLILLLAVGLGFAKPFGTAVMAMKGRLRRWGAGMLVALACVGTLPWAIGILLSYLGLLFWPAAVPALWLSGLAAGLLWAITSIKRVTWPAKQSADGERVQA